MIFLAFILLGIACIEFLIIIRQSIKYQMLKHFLKKYNAQMEMLIIINQDLQQKLDKLNDYPTSTKN